MKAVISVMLKNLARMVLTRKVIIWGLKLAAEKTENKSMIILSHWVRHFTTMMLKKSWNQPLN